MPWANIVVGESCSAEQQEDVRIGVARILQDLMNKPEQGVIVSFTTATALCYGAKAGRDGAVVDLLYIGDLDLALKRELTRRMTMLLAQTLHLNPMKVSVLMRALRSEDWGRNAGDYS